MRRRLTLLVLAVTSFVVVAYTIPLALLVDAQAEESARSAAERRVQEVASELVEVVAGAGTGRLEVVGPAVSLPDGVSVIDEERTLFGDDAIRTDTARAAVESRQTLERFDPAGNWELALPVITLDGPLVIQTVVSADALDRGVTRAWVFLAMLGVLLIGAALIMADRLGQTLRRPVDDIARAAQQLGGGDLETRVTPPTIPELAVVADAFNTLAPQLRNLLTEEREAMADLSHRLRTPLAALRLQSESLETPHDREAMSSLVDRMESSVDGLIEQMRRVDDVAQVDLASVARQHAAFWAVLAEEQGRAFDQRITKDATPVAGLMRDMGDMVDVLIGNVIQHTPEGTAFALSVELDREVVILEISDEGPGVPDGVDVFRRGVSGGGSTGLGLDIVRRTVDRSGGTLRIDGTDGFRLEIRIPITR